MLGLRLFPINNLRPNITSRSMSMGKTILDRYTFGETHLGRVGTVRSPNDGFSWSSCLFHHSIDLLEGETFGFPDHEVGVDDATDTG